MSTQLILDIPAAREARDNGINQAKTHADEVNPGWSEQAFEMFREWLRGWQPGYKFTIEEFRQIAQIRGLPDPPHARAFGSLAVRAKKAGLINSNGTVKVRNPKAHMANAAQWIKM